MNRVIMLFFSCVLLNACYAMEVNKLLRHIDEKDLPNLIGKTIRYPVEEPLIIDGVVTNQKAIRMATGILGEKVHNTDFYRIYCDETKKKGIARPTQELYYAD